MVERAEQDEGEEREYAESESYRRTPWLLEGEGASYFREIEWKYPAFLEENVIEDMTITTDFGVNSGAAAWSSA